VRIVSPRASPDCGRDQGATPRPSIFRTLRRSGSQNGQGTAQKPMIKSGWNRARICPMYYQVGALYYSAGK
jgi:hypothetical protein